MNRHWNIRLAVLLMTTLWCVSAVQAQGTAPATVWSGVKVVDAHGWEYTNVTLSWDQDGQALKMRRPDGATKVFRPDEITRVYDANGVDITNEIGVARNGGAVPPASAQPNVSGVGVVPVPAQAQRGATLSSASSRPKVERLFSVAIDAGVGFGMPAGTWFNSLEAGMNAQTGLRIMVGDRHYLHFAYRYQTLGKQSFLVYDYGVESIAIETSIHEFQFMLGRHTELALGEVAKTVGYAEFGIASLNHQFSADIGGSPAGLNRFGFASQGGVLLMMSEAAAFDLSISAVWKPGWSDNEGNGFVLGAHAGLTFLF